MTITCLREGDAFGKTEKITIPVKKIEEQCAQEDRGISCDSALSISLLLLYSSRVFAREHETSAGR